MESSTERTLCVFALIALGLWLVAIAPDEVKQGFMMNIMALLAMELWIRGQDSGP